MAGELFVPVKTAVMAMAAEAPDKAANGLRTVDFAVHNRLHNVIELRVVEQAKFADQIGFFTADGLQIFTDLIGVIIPGIGVVVVADDIDIRVGQGKRVYLFIGAVDDKLMRCPLTDPCRRLLEEIGIGIFQLIARFPGHDRFLIEVGSPGHRVSTGSNLTNHVQIGLKGFTVRTVKILRFFMIERGQLFTTAPPPPVVDKGQN